MKKAIIKSLSLLPFLAVCSTAQAHVPSLPDPAVDTEISKDAPRQTIVLAGGCFWGMQAVFQHVKGVDSAVSGYAGGTVSKPDYEQVSSGETGHAESVEITYEPSQISLGKLLKVYFAVAHDPTELNRQGPDTGTQYRSEIFYTTPEQEKVAAAYIAQLGRAKAFPGPIVTKVSALNNDFYPAEDYHQNYATLHPDNPYIAINDLPKVANLQKDFPDLYVEKR